MKSTSANKATIKNISDYGITLIIKILKNLHACLGDVRLLDVLECIPKNEEILTRQVLEILHADLGNETLQDARDYVSVELDFRRGPGGSK